MLPKNIKALIVDDEPIIRNLMKIFLGRQAKILESKDGAGALEMILAEKPDVVFLDISLPAECVNDFATPGFINLRCRFVVFQSASPGLAVG
jgi:CheY-like chemotaxis protein